MDVDLRQVLRSVRRWWWLLIAIPALSGGLALLYTTQQEPRYLAEAALEVRTSANTDNTYNVLLGSERQAKTYQRLVEEPVILQAAGNQLTPPIDPVTLEEKIRTRVENGTALLIVEVSDTDPDRAATIANAVSAEVVRLVAERNEASTASRYGELQEQIDELTRQINDKRAQVANLEESADAASSGVQAQITNLTEDINRLEATIAAIQQQQGQVLASGGDEVRLFSSAVAPGEPYAPRMILNVLLGVILGLLLAGGLVLLLEYLDNTVKATVDFGAIVGGPLLATVRNISRLKPGPSQLFVLNDPKGSAAESIRLLRTNIEFASATREMVSIGVTSPNPGEGKSTIAANLAVALAQAGFVTVLVDADLRRPSQHRVFEITNDRGLSTLLTYPDRSWTWAAHETLLPNLSVIPAGPIPPNPADLLSLDRLRQLLAEMQETVDVIIVDTPPVLVVSDPLIIAAHVDGMAIVTLGGKTRLDTLRRAAQTLSQSAVRLIGVVVNQQDDKESGYYFTEYGAVTDEPRGFRRSRPAAGASNASLPSLPATEQGSAD